ncbi:MAG: zinc-ribbon domain-containing protein, partial [Curvibacter sp.]
MSLITRCPACRTMFKVVPDQLKISEGWVRCGKCEEIFDARVSLQEQVAPAEEPAPAFEGELAAALAQEPPALASPSQPAPLVLSDAAPGRSEPRLDSEAAETVLLPEGSAYG